MTDPHGPLGPVIITGREIYDQLVRVGDAVNGLGTKVDRLTDGHVDVRNDLIDHETRIRGLERARWPLPSLAIVVSVGGLIFAIVTRT